MRPAVVLACGAQKRSTRSTAIELYTGPLFASARRWALSVTDRERIVILSARHGLVRADQEIEPYDQRLEIRQSFTDQLVDQAANLRLYDAPVFFAGGNEYRMALVFAGLHVHAVIDQLAPGRTTRGIGAQRAWYGQHLGQLPATDDSTCTLGATCARVVRWSPRWWGAS